MKSSRVESFSARLPIEVKQSVAKATGAVVDRRRVALEDIWGDELDRARQTAGAIKADFLDHLEDYLAQFKAAAAKNGMMIHEAADAEEANRIILNIVANNSSKDDPIVKAKSMATEEIHLNHHLEEAGYRPVETDLGEFVVQIDGDTPSHIVAPIIHKDRFGIAKSFMREGLGEYSEDPETLTKQAREHLRDQFKRAKVGISGVNFGIAESGRIVLVENEGNNRLATTAPDVHIAVMGIEKLLPTDADLALFTRLLGPSSTGQQITTYMHFIHGPRKPDELDGPKEVHVVLLDNGRRKVLAGPYRDILKCIRCGACLNVCPVYRQASGHAYGHVYSGPVGAVLAAALEGVDKMGDLAKASTLCGSCEEVCPVAIPIPDMLLQIRDEAERSSHESSPWQWFGVAAGDAKKWKASLAMLPMASQIPNPCLAMWTQVRAAPEVHGRNFRSWWKQRGESTPARMQHSSVASRSALLPEKSLVCRRVEEIKDPVASFEEAFLREGGKLVSKSDIEAILSDSVYADADTGMHFSMGLAPEIWDARIGMTLAEALVAETGSILVTAGPARRRMASLGPEVHIVLASKSKIVRSLDEAFVKLEERSAALITGPSRTADIEGVLVRGVHGPKELWLHWLD